MLLAQPTPCMTGTSLHVTRLLACSFHVPSMFLPCPSMFKLSSFFLMSNYMVRCPTVYSLTSFFLHRNAWESPGDLRKRTNLAKNLITRGWINESLRYMAFFVCSHCRVFLEQHFSGMEQFVSHPVCLYEQSQGEEAGCCRFVFKFSNLPLRVNKKEVLYYWASSLTCRNWEKGLIPTGK